MKALRLASALLSPPSVAAHAGHSGFTAVGRTWSGPHAPKRPEGACSAGPGLPAAAPAAGGALRCPAPPPPLASARSSGCRKSRVFGKKPARENEGSLKSHKGDTTTRSQVMQIKISEEISKKELVLVLLK